MVPASTVSLSHRVAVSTFGRQGSPETARTRAPSISSTILVWRSAYRDEDTAKGLGLTGAPVPAPWPVLARLPRGPELSKDAASVARDSIAGPS